MGVSMSVWDLSTTGSRCDSHSSGHQVFYIHFNVSMRNPGPVIPVTARVGDDGLVYLTGDELALVRWNHRPDLLAAALDRFDGMADWKPRWSLLAVPAEAIMGSAQSVFYLASPDQRSACRITRRTEASAAPRNTKPRIARGPIPPLRIAERYAGGRRIRRTDGH